jgi:Zn-dependent peptidase ImmA (M78 family)
MKRPKDFETVLGGKVWKVFFVRKGHPKVPQALGYCYWNDQEIYVRYDLSEKTVRMVLIHELLHGTCRLLFVAEEWVDQTATELNNALSQMG